MSTPVFYGMIAAPVIGLFLIPMLYVVFENKREWAGRRFGMAGADGVKSVGNQATHKTGRAGPRAGVTRTWAMQRIVRPGCWKE